LSDSVIDRASQAVEESIDQRGDLRGSSSYREYISGVLTDQVLNRIQNRLNGVN
jgi:CO/xanthine dehydrogenase FAD-binding subunit